MKRFLLICTLCLIAINALAQDFPEQHPTGAIEKLFIEFSEEYKTFFWRENGELWVEFEPLGEDVFVCGPGFFILQNGKVYDTTVFENIYGDSQCADITQPFVFKLTQRDYQDLLADLDKPFIFQLDHYDGNEIQAIQIPGSDGSRIVEGDLTDDGKLDLADALTIIRIMAGIE